MYASSREIRAYSFPSGEITFTFVIRGVFISFRVFFCLLFCRVLLQNSVALSRGRKVLFRLWLSLRTLGLKVARKIVNCVGSTQNI